MCWSYNFWIWFSNTLWISKQNSCSLPVFDFIHLELHCSYFCYFFCSVLCLCDSSTLICITVVSSFSLIYLYTHTHTLFNFVTIHYSSGDVLTFCSFLHIPNIAVLNVHVRVSVHMCKSFSIAYTSTSGMCNLIQRQCQTVFKSGCVRLPNYSTSLPVHILLFFFFNIYIYLFIIFGCIGSLLLQVGFL